MTGERERQRRRTSRQRPGLRDERGVALVEFTLVAPLLMLLLFGMVDFGKAFNYWIDETHLANSGARYAVVDNWPGKDASDPVSLHKYLCSEADTDELQSNAVVSIAFDPDLGPGKGNPVSVTMKVPADAVWSSFIKNALNLITSGTDIKAHSTMRLEKPPPYDFTATTHNCQPPPP